MLSKNCDNCNKIFEYRKSRQRCARFCSLPCLSKKTKFEQDQKRIHRWNNESKEDRMKDLIIRFEKYVIRTDHCWGWKGRSSNRYGDLMFRAKREKAHRVSWIIHRGEIPNGLWVLHKCDNRVCSNPDHLFLGNHSDNMRDMAIKGRSRPRSVLNPEQVVKIRELLKIGVSPARIAKDYRVSNVCIYYIKHNVTWKNLKG